MVDPWSSMDQYFELVKTNDECLPIKSLSELKLWKQSASAKCFSYPLKKRASIADSPKTLVCHDMKGGYLEDRFHNGSESEDNYFFIHWSMVDIFVYFSHHLVTIPPCGWISAAHQNGVKILGTFITEWDAGAQTCDDILYNMESVHEIATRLVNIANFYQFDGWLINIENKLQPHQVPLLEEFVRYLTLKMHESQKNSLVIWYDSVINSGELKWQNELNEYNRNFFDVCDGIFLNYNWNKEKLKKSSTIAASRYMDIFVGVDVFGRGCPGGGGFSTDFAVTAARDFNLSVAIFAPGWVYECLDVKCFKENQFKFWNSLAELCANRVTESLPYYTSFCPGFGKKMFRSGQVISGKPWYNLGLQQPQPTFQSPSGDSIIIHNEDALNGGGCLLLTSTDSEKKTFSKFGILRANFCIESTCCISYTFKSVDKNVKVALAVGVSNGKKYHEVNLVGEMDEQVEGTQSVICFCCGISNVPNVSPTSTKVIKSSDHSPPWIKRKYKVYCHVNEKYFIQSVDFHISWDNASNPEVSVLLGELLVSPVLDAISFSYRDLDIVSKEDDKITFECLLEWTPDTSVVSSDLYLRKNYICTTSQFCYSFKGCVGNTSQVEFVLHLKRLGKAPQLVFLKVPLK